MSAVNTKLTRAMFPILITTLLAVACSDSTGPSNVDDGVSVPPTIEAPGGATGTRSPASPAGRAPDSAVLTPVGPDTSAGPQISAALASSSSYTNAYCQGSLSSGSVRTPTQGGVQFRYTGSGSTQRVWFRANFWSKTSGYAATYLGSSEWFYTDLAPGQQSTTVWYRPSTRQWGSWQSTMQVSPRNGTEFYADMQYQWYQNARLVAQQLTRATHIPGGGATGGPSCYWYQWVWVPLL
jgi:hypothetical protein